MPQPKIDPPHLWKSDAIEQLHGSGFFEDAARTVGRAAKKATHSVAHAVRDRDKRHTAGAMMAAASPLAGPYAPAVGTTGAVLMASGKGKRAARTAKNVAKAATSKANTRKAMDIAQILANQFGGEQTQKAVGTAAALERAIQGEGLRLAGTGDYEVRPAVMPRGAMTKTKLMQAAKKARTTRKK